MRRGRLLRQGLVALAALALSLVGAGVSWGATYDPATDVNSMYRTSQYLGAAAWWNAGFTGKGVDVAVIDTGVSPVEGLATPGKIVYGPDLSLESQAPNLRNLDTNGHGTFMAGLIAGHDAALTQPYASAPASAYRGIAPDARIVSVKVGTADGGVDVTQVIAAIDWVVQHAHDPGFNIRVINLSYGTNSTQDYTVDPLALAAEQAWKHGIFVVVAGGNTGFQAQKNVPALADPAFDPYVYAVGASDSNGTASIADDVVPLFSPWPKDGVVRSVENVAPGAHIQGLRVPNSYVDTAHPTGRIDARYFRGSGTSEAAAIVSGAAALILQRFPQASPGDVKSTLNFTGYYIRGKSQAVGFGEIQLGAAYQRGLVGAINWPWPAATGTGSLDLARGSDRLTRNGVALTGEKDIFGRPFVAASMAAAAIAGTTWSGGTWNGSTWSGNSWSGNSWSGSTWSGNSWSGNSWSGSTWSGNSWSGNSWSGSTWSGSSWSGNSWSGRSWAGETWG